MSWPYEYITSLGNSRRQFDVHRGDENTLRLCSMWLVPSLVRHLDKDRLQAAVDVEMLHSQVQAQRILNRSGLI